MSTCSTAFCLAGSLGFELLLKACAQVPWTAASAMSGAPFLEKEQTLKKMQMSLGAETQFILFPVVINLGGRITQWLMVLALNKPELNSTSAKS